MVCITLATNSVYCSCLSFGIQSACMSISLTQTSCTFPRHQIFLSTTYLLKAWTSHPNSLEMDTCLCKNSNSIQLCTKLNITASYLVPQILFFISQVSLLSESHFCGFVVSGEKITTLLQLKNKIT